MGVLKESEVPHIAAVNRGSLQVAGEHMSSWPGICPSTGSWKELG